MLQHGFIITLNRLRLVMQQEGLFVLHYLQDLSKEDAGSGQAWAGFGIRRRAAFFWL